jgi:hypothetical protein
MEVRSLKLLESSKPLVQVETSEDKVYWFSLKGVSRNGAVWNIVKEEEPQKVYKKYVLFKRSDGQFFCDCAGQKKVDACRHVNMLRLVIKAVA